MNTKESVVLDDVALARVHGGSAASALAKGAVAGSLVIAPCVAKMLAPDKHADAVGLVTGATTWGLLGGWALHGVRRW